MSKNETGMTNAMSVGGSDWSDHELEQFHDGELVGPDAEALSEALRARPELRARLGEIARADGVILAALTVEKEAGVEGRDARGVAGRGVAARIGVRPVVWAAAAVLVIVGGGLLALKNGGSSRGVDAKKVPVLARNGDADGRDEKGGTSEPYQAVRVVFSLPLKAGDTWGATASAASATDEPAREKVIANTDQVVDVTGGEFIKRLDGALAAGRVDEALAMMKEARAEDREKAYARFGAAMRSSRSATEVMDALEPAEQVAACRRWIAAGTQKQFAMERLRMLGRRAELEESVRVAVRGLVAEDPSLRAWVMSYVPWAVQGTAKSEAEQG